MSRAGEAIATVRRLIARWVQQLAHHGSGRPARGDPRARAICPTDSWVFTPVYTRGACPLCGWTPEGYVYRPPLFTPYERYWGALAGIAALSVAMCITVVVAYTQT